MWLAPLALASADPGQASASGNNVTIQAGAPADPNRPRVEQAAALMKAGRAADALPLLDAVIADEAKAHARETRLVFCSRSMEETLLYMALSAKTGKGAVAFDATWSDALFLRGFALVDLGRAGEAEAPLKRATELAPMNAQYLAELAEWHKARKDWRSAKDYFDRAADAAAFAPTERKDAEQRRAWRGQAYVLTEQGRLDQAEALYRKCLAADTGDATARHELDYIAQLRRKAQPGA